MTDVIKMVQGDTKPNLVVTLKEDSYDSLTKATVSTPLNVADATVLLKLKKGSVLVDTVSCVPIAGYEAQDGTISFVFPYNIPGAGGRVLVPWTSVSLSQYGNIDGEVEVQYSDGTVQTVYDILKLKIRKQF